jgi:hypothetical protein
LTRQRAADGYTQARSFLSAEIQVNTSAYDGAMGSGDVASAMTLPRFSPEAEALVDELLPSWRSSAA